MRTQAEVMAQNPWRFPCQECEATFPRKSSLLRHKRACHDGYYRPQLCGVGGCQRVIRGDRIQTHRREAHGPEAGRTCPVS